MQVMMLILESAADFENRNPDAPAADEYWTAWQSYAKSVNDKTIGGKILAPGTNAVTMRVRDGERIVQDGPYADSKEALGGYMIFEVDTFEEAIELASTCPAAASGAVELRPIVQMPE